MYSWIGVHVTPTIQAARLDLTEAMLVMAHPSPWPDPLLLSMYPCSRLQRDMQAMVGKGQARLSFAHQAFPFYRGALLTGLLAHRREGVPGALCFSCKPDFFGMVGFYSCASSPSPVPHLPSPGCFCFLERALRQLY